MTSKPYCAAAIVFLGLASAGCYHTHLLTYGQNGAVVPWERTVAGGWVSHTAVVVPPPSVPDSQSCNNQIDTNGMHHVIVDSNLGYAALTVVTLGIVSPVHLRWYCAPNPSVTGPTPSMARAAPVPPPAVTPSTSSNAASGPPFTKRTLPTVFWGLLESDAKAPDNPPPPPQVPAGPPTPANCGDSGMRQVKVRRFPLAYLYSLATVATVGFFSPMSVEWQCIQPSGSGSAAMANPKEEANVSQ